MHWVIQLNMKYNTSVKKKKDRERDKKKHERKKKKNVLSSFIWFITIASACFILECVTRSFIELFTKQSQSFPVKRFNIQILVSNVNR